MSTTGRWILISLATLLTLCIALALGPLRGVNNGQSIVGLTSAAPAQVSPTTVAPGGTLQISFLMTLVAAYPNATVDVDVDNAGNSELWNAQWPNQAFTAGQTRQYSVAWAVPGNQALGSYHLTIKAFDTSGNQLYANGPLAGFTVGTVAAPPTTVAPASASATSGPPAATATVGCAVPGPTGTAAASPTTGAATVVPATAVPPTKVPATVVPATVVPTAVPPSPTTSAGGPSGQAMPVGDIAGWHQVFTDDFTQNVSLGSFPGAVSNKWWAYPTPWPDTTHNGVYDPGLGLSVHDGVLDMYLHYQNNHFVVEAPEPIIPGAVGSERGLMYGRYTARFKADSLPGYKTAWLLWPDSENWPQDGEIDFPEGSLNGNISAFMHRQGGTSGGDQDAYDTGVAEANAWHTVTTEWLPNNLTFLLDGKVIGHSTNQVPNTPMHWVLQTETSTDGSAPAQSTAGHVYVDWVAAYTPA